MQITDYLTRDFSIQQSAFSGAFYVLTGIHFLHVMGGLVGHGLHVHAFVQPPDPFRRPPQRATRRDVVLLLALRRRCVGRALRNDLPPPIYEMTTEAAASERARGTWLPRARRSALAGPAALVGAVMAVFAVLFWTLPAPAQTKPVRTDPASIAAGETLYDLHCSACHGVGGVGAKGPPLARRRPGGGRLLPFDRPHAARLAQSRARPGPPFFNDNQIAQIVAYVNYLDIVHGTPGPGIPDVTPPCGTETRRLPDAVRGQLAVPAELRPVPLPPRARAGC